MTAPLQDNRGSGNDELELRDYLGVLRRRKLLIAFIAILTVAAALTYSLLQAPVYQASAAVLIQRTASENVLNAEQLQNPQTVQQDLKTEIEIIRSRMIQDAVRKQLGYLPAVSVAAREDTQVVSITAKDTSAKTAAEKANGYAQAYVTARRRTTTEDLLGAASDLQAELNRGDAQVSKAQQQIQDLGAQIAAGGTPQDQASLITQRDQVQNDLDAAREANTSRRLTVSSQIDRLQLEATLNQSRGARVVSRATIPSSPVSPNPQRDGAVALVLGLLLGIGAAFLREYLDETIRTKDDLEAATGGLSTLGLVPRLATWKNPKTTHLESIEHPTGAAAEAYRTLRTSLQFVGIESNLRTIQFTSAGAGEGKTTTSANVAVALARAGRNVLLIDCDLRRPRAHHFFGLDNADGFTSVLLGEKALGDVIVTTPAVERLSILPSGPPPPAPSELLSTLVAKSQIQSLASSYDYVIVDSPPLLPVSDSVIIAGYVDAVVLVADAKATTKRSLHRAVEMLHQVNAPLVGTVFNDVDQEETYVYGGYDYRYEPSKV